MMYEFVKAKFAYLYGTFHDSESILWNRFNVLLGSLWVALQGVDVSPVIHDPKYLVYYIIGSNLINEMLRRRNAEWDPKSEQPKKDAE